MGKNNWTLKVEVNVKAFQQDRDYKLTLGIRLSLIYLWASLNIYFSNNKKLNVESCHRTRPVFSEAQLRTLSFIPE